MRLPSPTSLGASVGRPALLTLAIWAVFFVAAAGIIGAMLNGNLSSDMALLNRPDSTRGSDLLDQRMPQPNSESSLSARARPRWTSRCQKLRGRPECPAAGAAPGVVAGVQSYYETKMEPLVSADRRSLLCRWP